MTTATLTPKSQTEMADMRAKATETKRAQARLLADLAGGHTTPHAVLTGDLRARRIKVRRLVRAVPGYGTARTDQLMADLGIGRDRRVAGLGERQRRRLVEALTG